MEVYNIRKEKYSSTLVASGSANRWNKKDEFVIYTGSNRALSTLEMVVHRSYILPSTPYKLLTIEIQEAASFLKEIDPNMLPKNWRSIEAYPTLQDIGSNWYKSQESLVLKIPSVIIPQEYNVVINTKHPLFETHVKITTIEDFIWDERLL
ncbi:RES family NAD+ phosphorylase [Flavobacterium aquiphilum]|uniref:RES family NAD+ phosphorylase n=1 Tax=Flavobacterium aquiphilum TaxID=3003261 RepID=UPI0024807A7F|nr:RES family NAD+ phosphorylase [Flavobacterium aquiphilum]